MQRQLTIDDIDLDEYKGFIKHTSRKTIMDYEDFFQEAVLNLIKGLPSFDSSKGSLNNFIKARINYTRFNNSLRNERTRYAHLKKNNPDFEFNKVAVYHAEEVSIDTDFSLDKLYYTSRILDNYYNIDKDLNDILIYRYIEDMDLQAIGDKYGITHQAIQQRLARAKKEVIKSINKKRITGLVKER